MKINYLKYFVEISRTYSLSKAAKNLLITQSSLTRGIRRLEKKFGIILMNNTPKGIKLTKEGREFLIYAQDIIKDLEHLEMNCQAVNSQPYPFNLRLSSDVAFFLATSIHEIYKYIDNKKIDITLKETYKEQVIEDVIINQYEIGLITLTNLEQAIWHHLMKENEIEFKKIRKSRPYAYIGKNNPLYNREEIYEEELKAFMMIYLAERPEICFPYTFDLHQAHVFNSDKKIYLSNKYTIMKIIEETDAYALGAWCDFEETQNIRLIPVVAEGMYYNIGWLQRKGSRLSAEAKLFIELFQKHIKAKGQDIEMKELREEFEK